MKNSAQNFDRWKQEVFLLGLQAEKDWWEQLPDLSYGHF